MKKTVLPLLLDQQEKIYDLEIQIDELENENEKMKRENEKLKKENEINICWLNYYTKKYHDDYEIF